MRNRKALGLVLVATLLVAGCTSSQFPNTNAAYTAIYASVSAVQTSVSAFKQGKANGLIADPDGSKEAVVRDAYLKFRKTVDVALAIAIDVSQEKRAEEMVRDAMLAALEVVDAFTKGKR